MEKKYFCRKSMFATVWAVEKYGMCKQVYHPLRGGKLGMQLQVAN
jgi:hypothetical protein